MRPRRAAAEYTCTARRRREIARAEAARAVGAVGGGEEGAVELEVCPETVTVLPAHAAHAPGGAACGLGDVEDVGHGYQTEQT